MSGVFTIPLNEQGRIDYDYGIVSDNTITYEYPKDEFFLLCKNGVDMQIYEASGAFLDDCESAIIPDDKIADVLGFVSEKIYPTLYKALSTALLYKTYLGIDL